MAKALIAGSVLTNTTSTSVFTISSATALVHCSAGEIVLQIEISTGVWANLTEVDDDLTRPIRVSSGNTRVIAIPDTSSNYRLVAPNGKSTGSVYTL